MKTLAQWLAKIEAGHPTDIDMGLTRVAEVAKRLDLNFGQAVLITVSGTNGKGTTCRLIEQVCLAAGLSVGVYSSPHLLVFNERIRINAQNAIDADICEAFDSIEEAKAEISMTYFEYATLAAMCLFQRAAVDVVILEVGLGGRLDATNIIDADINIITSISLDHQDYLGNTLGQIAREKAGIVKANKRTVVGFQEYYSEAEKWLHDQNNSILRAGLDFSYRAVEQGYQGELKWGGEIRRYDWQASAIPAPNVMTAIASLKFLEQVLPKSLVIKLSHVLENSEALGAIIENTSLAGRAQLISRSPYILLDVAHNQASGEYLQEKLGTFEYRECHIVVGMLKDKNIEDTLQTLRGTPAHWYCASLPSARGQSFERLIKSVPNESAKSIAGFDAIDSALSSAIKQAANTDMIVIFGSFVTVSQAMTFFKTHPLDNGKTI
ncbi:bifunctional tetrahydrofolate synthase/dihydrofolate synthase [Glaciecola sp. SC05]|uniref:bifunctional tetrahydrofolate synthase/dihydrofolate synthase n=1 Tax=Glaciecola sp. SC05 TaxID=1987355 RepID=UPI0035270B64